MTKSNFREKFPTQGNFMRNERKFMAELRKDFLRNNIPSFILIDGADFAGRPFDMVLSWKSKFVAIEGKFQKNFSAFGMKNVRENQITNLNLVSKNKGLSFIFLNIWIPNKENRLLIWEWEEFKNITKHGTIKKKTLENQPFIPVTKKQYKVEEIEEIFSCFHTLQDL